MNKINKMKGEIQRNLLKGYLQSKGESGGSSGMMEISTRTPDKTNTELSPYMMDFYNMSSGVYEENQNKNKVRSNSNCMKYSRGNIAANPEPVSKTCRKNNISTHKKSKSQSSISGLKSMDNRSSQPNIPTEGRLNDIEKKSIIKII